MNLVFFTLIIWLVYLALTSEFSPVNLLLGLLVALIVTWLLRQRGHSLGIHHLARKPIDLLIYVYYQLVDLLKSGLQMVRIVFDPALPINPDFIDTKTRFDSELGMALSAHAITLTPGELVVEFDVENQAYLVHVLVQEEVGSNDPEQQKRFEVLERLLS